MGVKGKGLRSDGLHKSYMNGSPHDSKGATESKRTGGSVNISNPAGLSKTYGNTIPATSKPGQGKC